MNRSITGLILIILYSLISFSCLTGVGFDPLLEQEVKKPEILHIGTPVFLTYSILTEPHIEVYHPEKDTIGVFSLMDIKKTASPENNLKKTIISYRAAPFETGEVRFPSLRLELFDTINNEINFLRTEPVELYVQSLLDSEQPDFTLKDIAAPLRLGLGVWDIILPVIALILIITALVLLWRKLSGKTIVPEYKTTEDTRPAYQKALELLTRLKAAKLLEKGDYLEYYFRLSYILRFFLEDYYHFKAVEMTSSEIMKEIKDFPDIERRELKNYLTETDLVKFAKQATSVSRALELIDWLENYLRSFAGKEDASEGRGNRPAKEESGGIREEHNV